MGTESKYGRCVICTSTNETKDNQDVDIINKRINDRVRVASGLFTMNLAALTYSKKSASDYDTSYINRTNKNSYVGVRSSLRAKTREVASPGNAKHGSYNRYLLKKKKENFVLDANDKNNGIITIPTGTTKCNKDFCALVDKVNK